MIAVNPLTYSRPDCQNQLTKSPPPFTNPLLFCHFPSFSALPKQTSIMTDTEGFIPPLARAQPLPKSITLDYSDPMIALLLPKTSQSSIIVGGVQTDILVQLYADRIYVSLTQVGKLGSLLLGSFELSEDQETKDFDVSSVLGLRDDPLLVVYCRQLTEKLSEVDNRKGRSVLLAISLEDSEAGKGREVFAAVLNEALRLLTALL